MLCECESGGGRVITKEVESQAITNGQCASPVRVSECRGESR